MNTKLDNKYHDKVYIFVGIGGISMSALALMLKDKGAIVAGFDRKQSDITNWLRGKGIAINEQSYIERCDVAVISSAIAQDDCIIKKLVKLNKKIISRATLLCEIAGEYPFRVGVAGTHGKTTSTAMIAHIFKCANLPFTAHIGGFDSYFSNYSNYGEKIFLSEVCEYKKNISSFKCEVALLLNCSNDHIESYGSIEGLKKEFSNYLSGAKIAITDYDFKDITNKNCITFSDNNKKACYFASDVKYYENCIEYSVNQPIGALFKVKIDSIFPHDIKNSLSSVALARQIGIKEEDVFNGLKNFKGVKRRREILGKCKGAVVFADYAHHPEQIKNTLEALNLKGERYALLFQSHTFSRTKYLIKDFVKSLSLSNNLFIFDTYGAREKYDYLGSGKRLSEMISGSVYCGKVENARSVMAVACSKFPLVVVLGAGDLYDHCEEFLKDNFNG